MESAQAEGRASSMAGGGDGRAQLQGPDSAARGVPDRGDWRAQLPPETRKRVVIMLKNTLRTYLPIPELQSLSEIRKEAVRIEEMLYAAATSQPEYIRTVFRKKLSMANQTDIRQAPVTAEAIPEQNPGGPDTTPGLLPQGCNPGHLSVTMFQQAASLSMLGQSMPAFSQTSTLQDMSGVAQNTMNEGFTQGNPEDISATQRKLILQQQQMLMQQHIQQQQKPPMQQHIQQQSLLHPTLLLPTQQPMTVQKFSGLQPWAGQSTVPYFPTKQPILVSQQQQQQSIGQQSIFQHGSVSGPLQHESTLPIKLQSYPNWTSTIQPNNGNFSLEPLPRQKQEELVRMNEDMQSRQGLPHQMQLQLKGHKQSQKLQQAPMQLTHHHSDNDMNELKDMYMVVYLLLSMGILVAMLFLVYNHWWDLWRV